MPRCPLGASDLTDPDSPSIPVQRTGAFCLVVTLNDGLRASLEAPAVSICYGQGADGNGLHWLHHLSGLAPAI